MRRALVLGVNGQDGSFAAAALLARGFHVTGIAHPAASRYVGPHPHFTYMSLDLADGAALDRLLAETAPDYVFHLAAIHGPNAPFYEPVFREMTAVNVLSLYAALEYARCHNPSLRIAYASSVKIFGATPMGRIDEYNPRITTCLHSNTKNSAFDLIEHYRQNYRIAASNLILFNHESSRRPRGFFIPDLAACLSDALDDPNATRGFPTLDFYADWSDAAEFMDLAIDVAELTDGVDLLFASGITWYGRDFARRLFEAYGLDYTHHVSEGVPTNSAAAFEACIGRLEQTVGRRPLRSIFSIMNDLLPQRHRIEPVPTR